MIQAPVVQVWNSTGSSARGVIGGFVELAVNDVFCDVGNMKMTVKRDTAGVDLLMTDHDRQLKVIQQGAPDLWFLLDEDQSTSVSDDLESEPITFTCRSIAALLDETVVIPVTGVGTAPAEWPFSAATPGKVMTDLITSAKARGLLQNVTVSGNATVDASGNAWSGHVTVTYKAGTTLLSVIKGLAENQLLEWRFNGRVLELHDVAGALDRVLTDVLRPGYDVMEAPYTRSRRSVATAVLVEGDAGANAYVTQSLDGYRLREAYVNESSSPSGALTGIGSLFLGAHDEVDIQITHELTDALDSLRPWVDYRPGDRIPTAATPWYNPMAE